MDQVWIDLLKNTPWAAAAIYLGREMMRRWDEDRIELRELIRRMVGEIEEIKARLDRAGH